MADDPVGLGLDQRRAFAGAGAFGCLLHGKPDGERIVAVDGDPDHAVAGGTLGDFWVERDGLERSRGRIEVVFADKDGRRALDGREIQRFVKGAVVRRAVAEEGDADIVGAFLTRAHADTDGMADAGADDAVGPEEADGPVIEVHGAAAPAADAIGPAEKLGHDATGVRTLGQGMAVTTMGGRDPVGPPQMRTDADRRRLLSDVKVQEAGCLALAAGDLGRRLELAQEHHALEQAEQDRAVGQIARRRLCGPASEQGYGHGTSPPNGSGHPVRWQSSVRG